MICSDGSIILDFYGLVHHGRMSGATLVNDMPWSFEYHGLPVSHENDKCYIVIINEVPTFMTVDDVLVKDLKGEFSIQNKEEYLKNHRV